MTNFFDELKPLAVELDAAYLQALDRMEAHVIDTHGINQHVGTLLDRGYIEVLPFSSESTASPKELYIAFAEALAAKVMPELSIHPARNGYRTLDLIDWSDAPIRGNTSEREYQLAKIAHGRGRTMVEFLRQIIIRFSPTSLPGAAIFKATEDLISAFAVGTAMGTAIPVRREHAPATFRMIMSRKDDEPMWQVLSRHHAGILKGSNALATMALLNKEHMIATSISDMLNQFDVRLGQSMMRYESGQAFHGGTYVKLTLQRDGADFNLGQSLYDLVKKVLLENCPDVHLVHH